MTSMPKKIKRSKEMSVKLGTSILLIILVAVAFSGAGFLYGRNVNLVQTTKTLSITPTVETAGWKTYTNEKYGFSFKYPTDWKIGESTENNSEMLVYVQSPRKDSSLEFWFWPANKYALDDLYSDGTLQITGETVVAGQIAYWATLGGAGADYLIALEHNGIYQIKYGSDIYPNLSHDEIEVVSTFQFTK